MYKALICDLDGTLLDTIHSIAYFMNSTLAKFGIAPCRVEEFNYYAGNGARVLAERTLKSKGIEDKSITDKLLSDYKKSYDQNPFYKTEPFPGVIDVLNKLKENGIKLGVISNKPHSAVLPIIKHFFGDIFDIVLGQCDSLPLKPEPEVGEYAVKALGLKACETVFLGDTSVDVSFAKAYGAGKSVGVLWGFRDYDELKNAGADIIISDMNELLEVFKL